MDFLFPILAAVFQGASVTLDKAILMMKRVSYRTYIVAGFPIIFIVTLAIFLILRPPMHLQDFEGMTGLALAAAILIAAGTNFFFYRAMGNDGLCELQTADLLKDIPTIILVSILFMDERRPVVLIAAATATLAVVWSHWEHHKLKVKGKTLHFLLWVLLMQPVQSVAEKYLLVAWNPVSYEFIRIVGITLLLVPWFFKGTSKRIPKKVIAPLILTSLFSAVAWMLYYTSYKTSGVVYTVLLFALQPFLVYMASMLFLKERFHWKRTVGFVIVLMCVVIAQATYGG